MAKFVKKFQLLKEIPPHEKVECKVCGHTRFWHTKAKDTTTNKCMMCGGSGIQCLIPEFKTGITRKPRPNPPARIKCEECSGSYKNVESLTEHMRYSHNGIKPRPEYIAEYREYCKRNAEQ